MSKLNDEGSVRHKDEESRPADFLSNGSESMGSGPEPEPPSRFALMMGGVRFDMDSALATMRDGIVIYDNNWRYVYINPAGRVFLQLPPGEVIGRVCWEIHPALVGSIVDEMYHRAKSENTTVRFELDRSGDDRWYESWCYPTRDGLLVYLSDITERKKREAERERLNEIHDALSQSREALIHATGETEYLREVCDSFVKSCGLPMAWIGLALNDEEKSVMPVAHAGIEAGYIDLLKVSWADCPRGRGPTGTAIRTGLPCRCRNMLTDDCFLPWRDEATKRGYASSIALPLIVESRAIGAFTIYSTEVNAFSDNDQRFLGNIAGEIARGLTALRLRESREEDRRALRESKERLLLAQEAAHLGVFDIDFPSSTYTWSDEMKKIVGVPLDFRVSEEAWSALVIPDDLQRIGGELQRAIVERRSELDREYRIVGSDNAMRWIAERGKISYAQDGSPLRYVGTAFDVTPQKNAVKQVGGAERRVRQSATRLMITLVISIITIDSALAFFLFHVTNVPAWLETVLDPLMMLLLITPASYIIVFRPLLKLLRERDRAENALRQSHDELEQRVNDRTANLQLANNKLEVEIAERKKVEEAAQRSAVEYRLLMEEAADGILITNEEGKVLEANARFCEMLDYTKEEGTGMNVEELVSPEDLAKFRESTGLLNSGSSIMLEHGVQSKTGSILTVATSVKKLADGRYQAIVRDITKQRENEERFKLVIQEEVFEKLILKLRAFKHGQSGAMNLNRLALFAENLESVFGGPPAHDAGEQLGNDYANPRPAILRRMELAAVEFDETVAPELERIASLVMLADMEETRAVPAPQLHDTAEELLQGAAELREGLKGALCTREVPAKGIGELQTQALQTLLIGSIAKIKSGIDKIAHAIEANYTSDVGRIVQRCATKFEHSCEDVVVSFEDRTAGAKAIFNPAELAGVITVLIENSLDALSAQEKSGLEKGGRVHVLAETRESLVRVIVEDNGPGVPREILDKLFQMGVSTKSAGRGFGLNYAQACVRKYGGRLFADQSVERGAQFIVEVPGLYHFFTENAP